MTPAPHATPTVFTGPIEKVVFLAVENGEEYELHVASIPDRRGGKFLGVRIIGADVTLTVRGSAS